MFTERTSIGLDVHARSVVAAAIDPHTGELVQRKLTPGFNDITTFIHRQNEPTAVVYEAGPTGFGLARHLAEAGIRCVVAAPSKLQRPAGDRVKTARDAYVIAETACHRTDLTEIEVSSELVVELRLLVTHRADLIADRVRIVNRLRTCSPATSPRWSGSSTSLTAAARPCC